MASLANQQFDERIRRMTPGVVPAEQQAEVAAFSKAVAKEVGRYNIHVNCVCPGFTKTPATTERLTPELEARIVRSYPLGKLGVPEDVAKAVTFLASDGASHITGQTLSVSGGYSMV